MAALASGRAGAWTLLVERFGSPGGTGTAAMIKSGRQAVLAGVTVDSPRGD